MSTQNNTFLHHYASFYEKADAVLDLVNKQNFVSSEEALAKNKQMAHQIITTFHHLLFGLEENQKSEAVTYKRGALETILTISDAVKDLNEKDVENTKCITLETLKAIKCCVVRCPVGRNRCRSAGVFSYLQAILENNDKDEVLVDQALTVLAAISLNNDLNALQTCIQMKPLIEKICESHPHSDQIKKMSTYLNALFQAVSKEQSNHENIHSSSLFFRHLEKAQKLEIEAIIPGKTLVYSENCYTSALKELNIANSGTNEEAEEFKMSELDREVLHPLIRHIVGDIYQKRSLARYKQKKYEGSIEDARKSIFCVEGNTDAVERAEKVRIKSLVDLKDEGAAGEIAKAKLFVQDVNFLEEMLAKTKLG